MNKNLFFLALIFSFTYTVASEVQQFFYGIKVATIVTVITLGIQPTCGDTNFNNNAQGLLGYNPQSLSLLPAALDNNQMSKSFSSCLPSKCKPGLKGYVLLDKNVKSRDQADIKKEISSTSLPAVLSEQKTPKFCPADGKGLYFL